jgi:hypothetical protein
VVGWPVTAHARELLLDARELDGDGREHRGPQLADQVRAGGVAGRVLPVAEPVDLLD